MLPAFLLAVAASATPTTQIVPGGEITAAVAQAMRAQLARTASPATLEVDGGVADQVLPAGHAEVRVGAPAGTFPRAHAGVPVWLWVDARPVRPMTVWVTVHDERTVAVYAEPYSARTPVDRIRTEIRPVDWTCCAGATAAEPAHLQDARLRRAVQSGAPLLQADFEPLPAVEAQQPVRIDVARGAVHLSAGGVALADAGIGEDVLVRLDGAHQAIKGHVVAAHEVTINE
jgi:flagella basal body P-ring formation protein FlgA